jgi:hypothetical protein
MTQQTQSVLCFLREAQAVQVYQHCVVQLQNITESVEAPVETSNWSLNLKTFRFS